MDKITNDKLRQAIPYIIQPNLLTITRGIANLPELDQAAILQKVKEFDKFTPDNDPYNEHDFGSFEYNGQKIFWKIDEMKGYNGINLLLTIMFAEEY